MPTNDKPKKKVIGRPSATTGFGTNRGYSATPEGNYSGNVAPRTGGKAPKASGLKAATSKQMKAAKQMVRKGTGSGAKKRI
jgi:hypothetical protein